MAYLIAWVWLGEAPNLLSVAGAVLILTGVPIVNARGRRR
jgi:drug/metabolite transporter (DMT)-like permease